MVLLFRCVCLNSEELYGFFFMQGISFVFGHNSFFRDLYLHLNFDGQYKERLCH
jgi:hypothetical protein